MDRHLPPLNPLRMFEAAARLGSLTLAARELGVSQVAVSRQVRVLEQYLNVALFERSHRAIRLTHAGQALLDGTGHAFDEISASIGRVSLRGRQDVLRIQSYTTFSQRWLIPRLPIFHRDYPGIEIRLTSSTGPVDFTSGHIDAAIRSGRGENDSVSADLLATIELLPVCTSGLRDTVQLREPDDLRRCTLLYSLVRENDWAAWLSANCRADLQPAHGIKFESSALAYEAALQGLGVAMGIRVLVEQNLREGALVAPFPHSHVLTDAYYLLRPKHRSQSLALQRFHAWISQQLKADAAAIELSTNRLDNRSWIGVVLPGS